jgi:hypothetical protein
MWVDLPLACWSLNLSKTIRSISVSWGRFATCSREASGGVPPKKAHLLIVKACAQTKASRTRPSTPAKELFTAVEFEWFSKNAYNMSLKYCAVMPPELLVRLLSCCTEVSRTVKTQGMSLTLCSSSDSSKRRLKQTQTAIFAFDWCSVSSSLPVLTPRWHAQRITWSNA